VVDAAHFLELYASKQDIKDIPDLVLTPKEIQGGEAHIDSTHSQTYSLWSLRILCRLSTLIFENIFRLLFFFIFFFFFCEGERRVVDLLVEMIECADYVVLNKTDRVPEVPPKP
jgi:G3E family GTPase